MQDASFSPCSCLFSRFDFLKEEPVNANWQLTECLNVRPLNVLESITIEIYYRILIAQIYQKNGGVEMSAMVDHKSLVSVKLIFMLY